MHDDAVQTTTGAFEPGPGEPTGPWTRPSFEVICLACEISAYAPDGDLPLF